MKKTKTGSVILNSLVDSQVH